MRYVGLQTQIWRNNRNSILLLCMFPLIILGMIFATIVIMDYFGALCPLMQGGCPANHTTHMRYGLMHWPEVWDAFWTALPYTLQIVGVWFIIAYCANTAIIRHTTHAKPLERKDNLRVYNIVENLCIAGGIEMPQINIVEDNGLNAFATGRNPRDASVALTRGIINKLDDLELQGVIAHEMSHIGNRDIRLDMLLITGVGVTVFAADVLMRSIIYGNHSSNDDNGKNNTAAVLFMVWLAFTVFNFIVSPLLQLAVSRKREFAADACGAQITRNPAALASALRKISDNPRVKNLEKSKSMAIACIAEPRKALMGDLFSTHPSTKERIKRLESM